MKQFRVLIVNSYEYPFNLLADSSFTLTKSIIKALPSDKFYFIWALPEFDLPIPYRHEVSDVLDMPDNVSVLQVPMLRFRPLSELLLCEELFKRINPVNGDRCNYDIVLTNNPNVAGRLADWFASVLYKNIHNYTPFDPPIVLLDYSTPFYGNDCECAYAKYYVNKLKSMYLGYATADRSLFFTQFCFSKAFEQYRKFYSVAEAKEFAGQRAKIFPGLFSTDNLPDRNTKKRDVFSVYWGGRLAYGKKVKMITELVNRLYETGREVRMVLTLPDAKSRESLERQIPDKFGDIFEIHVGLSQQEAFKIMASCHASVFAQSMRFGPAAPLEQLCSGLVMMPFKRESGDVLPYEYPFYWSGKEELLSHLFYVYDNYDKAVETIEPYLQSIAKDRSLEGNIHQLVFEIENLVDAQDRVIRDEIVPSMSLLRGRVGEVREQARHGRVSYREYVRDLLKTHRVYSPLRYELRPFYLNPSLFVLYKVLRAHIPCNLLRDDPIFYHKKGE